VGADRRGVGGRSHQAIASLIRILAAAAALAPASAAAHGFGALYNLPVPFWLYAWGAGCALVLSFLVVGFFASAAVAPPLSRRDEDELPAPRPILSTIAVFLLLLTIATGFFGNRDPYRNFSMTFFWIVFVLGVPYLTALIGNFWPLLNPWRALTKWSQAWSRGRIAYPAWLGDWPALALYLAFIWFELFGLGRPVPLAKMLTAYTALNLVGVWLVGAKAWFCHCELFSVFLQLIARIGRGLSRTRPESMSTVAFVLAMLSTTAFDGLRATQWWVGLFWQDPTGIVTALAESKPILVFPKLRSWYIAWETFWLLASPFVYLAVYVAFIALVKLVTRTPRTVRELALDFAYTLLPIVLVYNATHYSTLILTQGLKIVSLASDPFGWGWNLFGTATMLRRPILPPMGVVWHSQVALILIGHIASVYCAHRVALRLFPTRGKALASQLPMLVLMVMFTVAGLWILAQPLTAMLMR
jgi:hypothetical protein